MLPCYRLQNGKFYFSILFLFSTFFPSVAHPFIVNPKSGYDHHRIIFIVLHKNRFHCQYKISMLQWVSKSKLFSFLTIGRKCIANVCKHWFQTTAQKRKRLNSGGIVLFEFMAIQFGNENRCMCIIRFSMWNENPIKCFPSTVRYMLKLNDESIRVNFIHNKNFLEIITGHCAIGCERYSCYVLFVGIYLQNFRIKFSWH